MKKKDYSLNVRFFEKQDKKTKSQGITIDYLVKLEKYARSKMILPAVVNNKKEADRLNRVEKLMGKLFGLTPHKWNVGDEYYTLLLSDSILKTKPIKKANYFYCNDKLFWKEYRHINRKGK